LPLLISTWYNTAKANLSTLKRFIYKVNKPQKGWKQAATQRVQPDLWLFEQGFA
jgi:hypothetical protein